MSFLKKVITRFVVMFTVYPPYLIVHYYSFFERKGLWWIPFLVCIYLWLLTLFKNITDKTHSSTIVHFVGLVVTIYYGPKWMMDMVWSFYLMYPVWCVLQFLFLEKKIWNRPVYLAFSKQSMLCTGPYLSFLDKLGLNKHWMIVVPAFNQNYYVLHAKGQIVVNLEEAYELMDKAKLDRSSFGFYRLGLTNREILKSFRKRSKSSKEVCWTCQQYVNRSACFLVYPSPYVCFLCRVYGRMSFYILIILLSILGAVNWFYQWNLPISAVFFGYYAEDFFDEDYCARKFDFNEIRDALLGVAVSMSILNCKLFHDLGSLRIALLVIFMSIALRTIVGLNVPKYVKNTKETEKKKKK